MTGTEERRARAEGAGVFNSLTVAGWGAGKHFHFMCPHRIFNERGLVQEAEKYKPVMIKVFLVIPLKFPSTMDDEAIISLSLFI